MSNKEYHLNTVTIWLVTIHYVVSNVEPYKVNSLLHFMVFIDAYTRILTRFSPKILGTNIDGTIRISQSKSKLPLDRVVRSLVNVLRSTFEYLLLYSSVFPVFLENRQKAHAPQRQSPRREHAFLCRRINTYISHTYCDKVTEWLEFFRCLSNYEKSSHGYTHIRNVRI